MRVSSKHLLFLGLFLAGCRSHSNPLIGTWIATDQPAQAGCEVKLVFTSNTMHYEDNGWPGLAPPRSGTVSVTYGGSPNTPNQIVVQNLTTGQMDDWDLTDATHAISGNVAQCHYAKQ